MALQYTAQKTYSASDFKDGNARFAPYGTYRNMTFANISFDLALANAKYGFATIQVTYTADTDVDSASVFICHPGGATGSFSDSAANTFLKVNNNGFYIDFELTANSTAQFLFVANIDESMPPESTYVVNVALGKENGTTSGTVTVSYDCIKDPFVYDVGMHVYSPYDAYNAPKLSTTLYSFIPIENWTEDTLLFSTKGFEYPAFPYYYSYGSKVYKVGGKLDRTYGTFEYYKTVRKNVFAKPDMFTKYEGPKAWYDETTDTSPSCIVPVMTRYGVITQIIDGESIPQPSLYRYLGGYNANDKVMSNDNTFATYVFGKKSKYYPITGAMHALEKVSQAFIKAWKKALRPPEWPFFAAGFGIIVAGVANGVILKSAMKAIMDSGSGFSKVLQAAGGTTLGSIIGWAILAVLILILVIQLLKKREKTYREPCLNFHHFYVQNEYIEVGDVIWEDIDLTIRHNGYYCDGVYFYRQNLVDQNLVVDEKTLSYTNALISRKPIERELQFSIPVDVPTYVTSVQKLIVLPYTSGIPVDVCGTGTIYESDEFSAVITSDSAGDLMQCESQTIILPAGFEWSCISKEDANIRANAHFQKLVEQAEFTVNQSACDLIEGIDVIDAYFTHELANEITPNLVGCYYDNTDELGLIVGRKMYYDVKGYYEVLDGYYSILTNSTPYKIFYKTVNGEITEIWTQETSSSTSVTNGGNTVSLSTDSLDYTSEWYWYDNSLNALVQSGIEAYNAKDNPNSYLSNGKILKSKRLDGTECTDDIIYWDGSAWVAAETSWYLPLTDWIDRPEFYYIASKTIFINFQSVCPESTTLNAPYGVNLQVVDGDGNPTAPDTDMSFTLQTLIQGPLGSLTTVEEKTVTLAASDVQKYVPHLEVSINDSIAAYRIPETPFSFCKTTGYQGTTSPCTVTTETGKYLLQRRGDLCETLYIPVIAELQSNTLISPSVDQFVKASMGGVTSCWKVLSTSATGAVNAVIISDPFNECTTCLNTISATCSDFKTRVVSRFTNGIWLQVVSGGTPPYSFYFNRAWVSSNSIGSYQYSGDFNDINTSTPFELKVVDANGCTSIQTVEKGWNTFDFPDADYVVLTFFGYKKSTFNLWRRDLNIRCRMITPPVGQDTLENMLGWGWKTDWPPNSTSAYLKWSGNDNEDGNSGHDDWSVETVLFDVQKFKQVYPNYTGWVKIDLRGYWYTKRNYTNDMVYTTADIYKGGTPIKGELTTPKIDGEESEYEGWLISQYDEKFYIDDQQNWLLGFSSLGSASKSKNRLGKRISTFNYNIGTGYGYFDNYDEAPSEGYDTNTVNNDNVDINILDDIDLQG